MIVDKATYIEKGKYNSYTFPTLQGKDEKMKRSGTSFLIKTNRATMMLT